MFYSHQLLAKKAPLGQIWMAATLHAKINRRKLDKLDIIKICEEILNPQVPMALRLSGILMGGVVIVYEKKVKLLYDDATRFLMEVNEAGKVKPAVDRTLLPKNRAQAKYEAVTLPAVDMEVEHSVPFISDANTPVARFRSMRLDDLDEQFIHIDPRDDEEAQNHHQVDAANITLFDDLNTNAETYLNDRFERFDIGEDEIQMNVHEQEEPTLRPPPREVQHPKAPSSHISSPATHHEPTLQDEPMMEEQDVQHPDVHMNAPNDETEGTARKQQHKRRKPREWANQIIIDEQVMITGNVYQSWLQDTSSIKRRRRTKPRHPIFTTKTDILWDLPPVALLNGLENFPTELYYPEPLLKLWRKGNQASPARSSPSGVTPPERQQNPASHSPPAALSHRNNIPEYPPGDVHSEVGSQPSLSIERGMVNEFQAIFDDAHITPSGHFNTSTSPAGASSGSIPSSGSGHSFQPYEQEEILPPFTKNKRRQFSSARSELGNLETVEEEFPVVQDVRSLKIPRISQNRLTNDSDLLEETMPTQTPIPVVSEPSIDKITQSICSHLKLHFDTPGNPQSESLDQLSIGMTKKKAAQLFYQTCVMATLDFVKVDQKEAYGDILISKGPKM